MKMASSLLLSLAFHVAVFTLPLSLFETKPGDEELIPVVFVNPRDGLGQEMASGGKAKAGRGHENHVTKKPPKPSLGSAGEGENAPPSTGTNRSAGLNLKDMIIGEPGHGDSREPAMSIGPVSLAPVVTVPPGGEESPRGISRTALGEKSGAGLEARGHGSVGDGSGAEDRGGGSVSGSIFAQAGYVHNPKPPYPERARKEGWEGTVLLRVLVDREGKSKWIEINRSSGFETLDAAAVETVKRWRFYPARYGERKIESWVRIPIIFRLSDQDRG